MNAKTLRQLSLMLCIPNKESLSLLISLATEQPWMQAGLDELARTPLPHWQGEYTRLFVKGFPKAAAPPYESVYLHQTMFGPVVNELHELYQEAGLVIGEMPADYLGTQLEFAAHLAASNDPRAVHWLARLWQDHMRLWLPHFITDLCLQSRLLIYRLWAGQLTLLTTTMNGEFAHA